MTKSPSLPLTPGRRHKENLLLAVAFAYCALIVIAVAFRPTYSYDGFWLLQMGLDGLQGLDPLIDRHSFTHAGEAVDTHYLAAPYLLAGLVRWLGVDTGFSVFVLLAFAPTLGLLFWLGRRAAAPPLALAITALFVTYFLELRAFVRPELLTYPLLVALVYLSDRARFDFSHRRLAGLAVLIVIAVNYHSPVLAYVVVFGLFLDRALAAVLHQKAFKWRPWLGWGITIAALGFVNPDLRHFLLGMLQFSSGWREYILEYRPVLEVYSDAPPVYLLFAFAGLLTLRLVWCRDYGHAFVVALLMLSAWQVARLLTPVAMIVMTVTVVRWREIAAPVHTYFQANRANQRAPAVLLALLVGIGVYSTASQALRLHDPAALDYGDRRYAGDVASYLERSHIGGRILNQFRLGGYLAYRLPASFTIYIDGRTNFLYGLEFYQHYVEMLQAPGRVAETIDRYDIDFALFEASESFYWLFKQSGRFSIEHVGEKYMLWSRGDGRFRHTGRLLFEPYCLLATPARLIAEELKLGQDWLAANSLLKPLHAALSDGAAADAPQSTDPGRRGAAYRALAEQRHADALNRFLQIEQKTDMDVLLLAYGFMHTRQTPKAIELLGFWTRVNAEIALTPNEAHVLRGIAAEIKRRGTKLTALDALIGARPRSEPAPDFTGLPWSACAD